MPVLVFNWFAQLAVLFPDVMYAFVVIADPKRQVASTFLKPPKSAGVKQVETTKK
jgi:hypothetical protein